MTTGYQIKEQDKLYFITIQVVDWIDVFSREIYRNIIVENLDYCQKHKGLEIYAWVIMSNHIHLLLKSNKEELSNTLRDFKSYTSKRIIEEIEIGKESRQDWMLQLFKNAAYKHKRNSGYQFWTHENHAEIVYSNSFLESKIDYIHHNPVRAGIVDKPEEYKYSSAIDYAGGKGLLLVEKVMLRWKTY